MSSMSKLHDNDDENSYCNKPKQSNNVLLKCNNGFPISIPAVPIETPAAVNRLATLSLNTEHFCFPCIKFEFSTNITSILAAAGVEIDTSSVTVAFQLYRLCRGETIPATIGSPWVYSLSNPSDTELTTSDTVTFIVCDCDCDCDCVIDTCCSYYVEASTIGTGTASITLNNPTLSALVVEIQRNCC